MSAAPPARTVEPSGATHYITPGEYAALLRRLAQAARTLEPAPDAVIGVIRSGLFPAVYLSHQLKLPLFTSAEAQRFPYPRLKRPLIVDTTAWSGGALRNLLRQLCGTGAQPVPLVMFACAAPLPAVDGLHYLEASARIPRFWYEKPGDCLSGASAAPEE
jgi:hypothetical protein